MKRSRPNLRHGVGRESCDALAHLLTGFIREGKCDDLFRRDAFIEQMKNAPDERARLAGSGAGGDEQGRMHAVRRRPLAFVKR